MTLPAVDSIGNLDMPKKNYAPVVEPTVDRDAGGANVEAADVAAMTHTAIRAWVRATLNGASTPTIVAHDANWGGDPSVVPTPAHTGTGTWTFQWPASVSNEVPSGMPGYTGPQVLNLRAGVANMHSVSTAYLAYVTASANVATLRVFTLSGGALVLTDPSGAVDVDIMTL